MQPQPFIAKSFNQMKKEYQETPFWLLAFPSGSQFTITEDLPVNKPFRFHMRPSNKGGPAYPENLIKITDGYTEKDLAISQSATFKLLRSVPLDVKNLKGVTLANNNGNWEFICQTDESVSSGFNAPITQPQQPQDQKETYVKMLVQAMKVSSIVGTKLDTAALMKIADSISPGNALELITKSKQEGYITESAGMFVARD